MSETKKPPAFFCPDCGQKHRTNLDSLAGKAGAVLRLHCVGCKIPLAVSLNESAAAEDGRPVCVRDDNSEEKKAGVESPAPAPQSKHRKNKKKDAPVSRRKGKRGGRSASGGGEGAKVDEDAERSGKDTSKTDDAEKPRQGSDDEGKRVRSEPIQAEFADGDAVGRYTIEKAIGKGGCSTVYQAFDPTTNRSVALKILADDVPEVIEKRFLREIEVQANIRHQNIMPVFDRGALPDGRPFFTMELLYTPWTLGEIIQFRDEGKLSRYATLKKLGELENLVRDVLVPIADGIYVANVENGVIHRDLKPENVLVDSRTLRPYVIDFGICHVLEKRAGIASKTVIPPTTEDEGIVGTPRFLAPEQVKGSVHARTDVWGLGATLHAAIAGEPPIASAQNIGKSELKRRVKALQETKNAAIASGDERKIEMCEEMLVRLTDPSLRTVDELFKDARDGKYSELPAATPAGLKAVVAKAMSVSTSDRYVNARQFGTELQAWLDGARVRALTEVGGKAAAVETARRAVRTHTVTAVWLLVGAALGLGLAFLFAKPGDAPPSSRVADAKEDIDLLDESLAEMDAVAPDLTAIERHRLWFALESRARQIHERLAKERDAGQVRARRERLAFVRSRFQPPRFRFDFPASMNIKVRNQVTGTVRTLRPGEHMLSPGAYAVTVGDAVRFPLDVPLVIRKDTKIKKAAIEPPLAVYSLPLEPSATPAGMRLVIGGRVLARDRPFNPPSTAPTTLKPFLMDETEVTNAAYGRFLASLPTAERKERAPRVAFVPDPAEDGAPTVIRGRENAPVVAIRPEDAAAYTAWRSKQTGTTVRLPSEAEWVLAAGAELGADLANAATGLRTEADFTSPLRDAGSQQKDIGPYWIKGLLGNAREMVAPSVDDQAAGAVLVKGAGVGDDPDQGAIYIHRVLKAGERHPTTGFRCVQEIPQASGPPR